MLIFSDYCKNRYLTRVKGYKHEKTILFDVGRVGRRRLHKPAKQHR